MFKPHNNPPIAILIASRSSGVVPLEVELDASLSQDPDGDMLFFTWKINNQVISNNKKVTFVFNDPGNYTVTLIVQDKHNTMASTTIIIDALPHGKEEIYIPDSGAEMATSSLSLFVAPGFLPWPAQVTMGTKQTETDNQAIIEFCPIKEKSLTTASLSKLEAIYNESYIMLQTTFPYLEDGVALLETSFIRSANSTAPLWPHDTVSYDIVRYAQVGLRTIKISLQSIKNKIEKLVEPCVVKVRIILISLARRSGSEYIPSLNCLLEWRNSYFVSDIVTPASNQSAIVLIHGFRLESQIETTIEELSNFAMRTWGGFAAYLCNSQLVSMHKEDYEKPFRLYAFVYNPSLRISENGKKLADALKIFSTSLILIGHSMGGLVARSAIEEHNLKNVKLLITLGTPHLGTPIADYFDPLLIDKDGSVIEIAKDIWDLVNDPEMSAIKALATMLITDGGADCRTEISNTWLKQLNETAKNSPQKETKYIFAGSKTRSYTQSYYKLSSALIPDDNDGLVPISSACPYFAGVQNKTFLGIDHTQLRENKEIFDWLVEQIKKEIHTNSPPSDEVTAKIVDYQPSSKIQVSPGQNFVLRVTFQNTGNTAWDFWGGYTIWDASGRIVADGWSSGAQRVQPGQQGTFEWQIALSTPGEYWLQFGVWKQQGQELLARAPSPSQNLIKVR
ncbi:MAG: PKD domain-containing protein [Nanopusillaceae archaeon]